MRDPIPPAKSETQLSRVLAAHHYLKLGTNQRGRVALYSNVDRWLCYLEADSASALRAIAEALDQFLTGEERPLSLPLRPPVHDLLFVGWLGFLLPTRYKVCRMRMSSDFSWAAEIEEDFNSDES